MIMRHKVRTKVRTVESMGPQKGVTSPHCYAPLTHTRGRTLKRKKRKKLRGVSMSSSKSLAAHARPVLTHILCIFMCVCVGNVPVSGRGIKTATEKKGEKVFGRPLNEVLNSRQNAVLTHSLVRLVPISDWLLYPLSSI